MMPLYVYTHSQNITSPFYDNRYCRDACFKRCWDDHTRLHQQQAKADLEQQQAEKQFKRGSKLNDGDVDDDEIKPTAASIEVDGNNAIADAMHDDDEAKPKATAMKVDTSSAVKTAGLGLASPAASSGVRIEGAMDPNSALVNGVYEDTRDISGDMPVHVKVGYNDVCMEYHADSKSWQVKNTEHKGTDACLAGCVVPAKGLPEKECPVGKWGVYVDPRWIPLPTIIVSFVSKDEVEAYREEQKKEAAREVKGHHNVRITGAKGVNAGHINGVYKPTEELCGNVTVYVQEVDNDVRMEYNASSKEWQVKSTEGKEKQQCAARCIVPAKCLPEECPGKWYISDGTKFCPQRAVTITLLQDGDDDADDDEA